MGEADGDRVTVELPVADTFEVVQALRFYGEFLAAPPDPDVDEATYIQGIAARIDEQLEGDGRG